MKDYHCCATCIHFLVKKEEDTILMKCKRLGYHTKSYYQFDCWDPKPRIRELMNK
ncbi:hypothetical protein SAMN05421676_10472 [Salinibacillus kushneri]|uniref:Uncharacterized protein n=1 Tax=Salinibacillus kushneri TaxID=237682 RepID=A0A1I0DMM4_9BACI|nr:hypothetical protein [Salinibacillus kushneri]SET33367.1 hypothetical protein SAMN05421676_10472 [Salinibacillus kushneri]